MRRFDDPYSVRPFSTEFIVSATELSLTKTRILGAQTQGTFLIVTRTQLCRRPFGFIPGRKSSSRHGSVRDPRRMDHAKIAWDSKFFWRKYHRRSNRLARGRRGFPWRATTMI